MPVRPYQRFRPVSLWWLAAAAIIVQLLLGTSSARSGRIACDGAIQHPLAVRITALDPVLRGGSVRLRVEASTRASLTATEAAIVDAGGAVVTGARSVRLGRLQPGDPRQAEFRVSLPAQGHRFLVQFKVRGEGLNGPVTRGATFNLLPEGPQQPVRVVANRDGQAVAEYAARRIER